MPARNERGNIHGLFERLPKIDAPSVEVILVEGHSTDGTWQEILRLAKLYEDRWRIRTLRQAGIGKADAVRAGLDLANGDVLAIFDADLSVPPEALPQFYEAYVSGTGEFIMGNRFVEPMEPGAMRLLNRWGNLAFARLVSWILRTRVGDCLCGTKLFARSDYARLRKWREEFGDVDPFGDFELLFAAAVLGLRIVELPIPYRARTYGRPSIRRFRDGVRLLAMCWHALWRAKAPAYARNGRESCEWRNKKS